LALYRWLTFNVLVGNGDNHLKNISFLVDDGGINLAPAYDMLCTAVYDTRALAGAGAKWPDSELAFSLGSAKTFGGVRRQHLFDAATALGLAPRTATRELDSMLAALPREADKLVAAIEASQDEVLAHSPQPQLARNHFGGEMRMLRAARLIVIADMCAQLAG
jgi:serine/threonine-protein kinase HipA